MITFKFILMVLLAVLPYLFTRCVKGKMTMVSVVIGWMPSLKKAARKAAGFARRIHENMKRSDNARKFFRMLLIIILLLYTWTEFSATDSAAKEINRMSETASWDCGRRIILLSVMADPYILLVCLIINLSLFHDRWANRLLTEIHASRHLQAMMALFILMMVVLGAWQTMHYFILAEVIYIILAASWAYPEKVGQSEPKGGIRVKKTTTKDDVGSYRQAA